MECLGGYTFLVMTSVILSGGMKMRDEHGMLREVYIYCDDHGDHGQSGAWIPGRWAQSGARFTVVCGSSAGSRGWKAAATLSEWAHGPATSVRGCHRQKGAPCALRETAVDESLPYWPGGWVDNDVW